jgi:hypothetical protein
MAKRFAPVGRRMVCPIDGVARGKHAPTAHLDQAIDWIADDDLFQ